MPSFHYDSFQVRTAQAYHRLKQRSLYARPQSIILRKWPLTVQTLTKDLTLLALPLSRHQTRKNWLWRQTLSPTSKLSITLRAIRLVVVLAVRPGPLRFCQHRRWRWIRPLLAHPPQHRRRWLLGIRRQGWRGAAAAHVMCQVIPRRPVHRLHRGARAYSHRVRGSVVAGGASSDDPVPSSLSHTVHVHAD